MNAEAKPVLTGGCQCGAIRFAVKAAPVRVSICHCRMCQKASGAPFASFADIEHADFAWTKGKPAAFRSSSIAERDFCAELRHAVELPPHRRPAHRDHDRHLRPAGPGDPDAAIWHGIPARLGGRQSRTCRARPRMQNYGPEKMATIASHQHPDHD